MAKRKLLGGKGVEINTDEVAEVKKAPGDNDVYLIFVNDRLSGRVRYMGDADDAKALGFNTRTGATGGTEAAGDDAGGDAGGTGRTAGRAAAGKKAARK